MKKEVISFILIIFLIVNVPAFDFEDRSYGLGKEPITEIINIYYNGTQLNETYVPYENWLRNLDGSGWNFTIKDLTTTGTGTFGDLFINTDLIYTNSMLKKIGINTNSPNKTLHIVGPDGAAGDPPTAMDDDTVLLVENTGGAGISIISDASEEGFIKFYRDTYNNYKGAIIYHDNDWFRFYVDGVEEFRLTSSLADFANNNIQTTADITANWGFFNNINTTNLFIDHIAEKTPGHDIVLDNSLLPSADNSYDLGSAAIEFKNLFLDGTGRMDRLQVDSYVTSDLNPGTPEGYNLGTAYFTWANLHLSHNANIGGDLNVTGTSYLGNIIIEGDNLTINKIINKSQTTVDVLSPLRIIKDGSGFSTPYTFSIQSNTSQAWMEILNEGGAGKGFFFGISNNDSSLWSYQGGSHELYTSCTQGHGTLRISTNCSGATDFQSNSIAGVRSLDFSGGTRSITGVNDITGSGKLIGFSNMKTFNLTIGGSNKMGLFIEARPSGPGNDRGGLIAMQDGTGTYEYISLNDAGKLTSKSTYPTTISELGSWWIKLNTGEAYFNNTIINGDLNVTGTSYFNGTIINAGKTGLTANYSVGPCWQYFTGGILTDTNCTSL